MGRNNRHKTIKKLLFAAIISLLFLPMLQQQIPILDLKPLNGSFETVEKPEFTIHSWLEGEYQVEQEKYINQHVGFRSFFIRLYNQYHFSLYSEAKAKGVVVGKANYLYETNYIEAYFGNDFIGSRKIKRKIQKLERICDTLKNKNIDLIVILAPGKASFYPEFIPEKYRSNKRTTTNYEVYAKEISKTNIHLLDFHSWFGEMKASSRHPLFPKTGIHWSKYGEFLAADSLIHYINSIRKDRSVPELILENIETSSTMRDRDDDIEKGMNLLYEIEDLQMGYPHFQVKKNNAKNAIKALVVGDSYYWGMYNWGCSRDVFNNGQFWYYNKQIHTNEKSSPTNVSEVNIAEEVETNDVVILLSTEANLDRFAFGFIDQLYDAYVYPEKITQKKKSKEERIQVYIKAIKKTPKWINSVREQALKENITLEEAIRKNAEFMVWREDNKR